MSKKLHLAKGLELPAEFCGRRTALFGISGSGKSNSATVVIEEAIAAGEQVVFIDPKGEAWGLLSLPNGKPSNLDMIIFGEPCGHIPAITEHHGPQLADFVVDSGRSIAVSMLGFESDAAERRFAATFLRRLYKRKTLQAQKRKTRTLVVFEEAHLFMPEGGLAKGDVAELSGACQRIVRQGRSFGLGSLIIDQRPQDVAKRVVTQCDTLVCHQLTHNKDRQALAEWVSGYDRDGRGDEFLASLATLQPGEVWIWSPAWLNIFQRVKMRRRRTFDSGASADDAAAVKVRRAEIDLDALKGQLDELVAQAKADDPKELKRRLAEAEVKLKKAEAAAAAVKPAPAPAAKRVEVPVITDKQIAALQKIADKADEAGARAGGAWGEFRKAADELRNSIRTKFGQAAPPPANASRALMRPALEKAAGQLKKAMLDNWNKMNGDLRVPAPKVTRAPRADAASPDEVDVTRESGLRRLLVALAQFPDGLGDRKLSIVSRIAAGGGTWRTYMAKLRGAGYCITEGEKKAKVNVITQEGLAALGHYVPLPLGAKLRAHWQAILGDTGKRRIFDAVCAAYPNSISDFEVGQEANVEPGGGTWRTYMATLRGLDLVVGSKQLKAADELFAE